MSRGVLRLVRVRFPGQHRAGTFLSGRLELAHGQKVVAMSERGMAVGYVNSTPFEVPFTEDLRDLKYVSRIATTEDINKYKALYQRQRDTRTTFQQLASGHGLNVNLVDIEFTSFGKKAIFYFTGPERIDFRELIKSLSKVLKIQIELKQVPKGSSGLGEVGPCGEERCQFVNSLMENDPHNKRRCNEYYCLLEHKDPFYEDQRSRLPKVGDLIRTRSGDRGRVERLDLWNGEFEMITDQGVRRRTFPHNGRRPWTVEVLPSQNISRRFSMRARPF